MQISKLPKWVLVEKFPAFNDLESLTAIEQTARVYGKINEIIESYNKYVEEINKTIEEIKTGKTTAMDKFIDGITCLASNYINTVDMKIIHQDRQIAEVYNKFQNDIITAIQTVIIEMKQSGDMDNVVTQAISELWDIVDTHKANCDVFMHECTNFKNTISSDIEAFKSAMDIKFNENVSGLAHIVDDEVVRLQGEYAEYKTELDNDYNTAKTNLNNEISDVRENVAGIKVVTDNIADYIVETGTLQGKGVEVYKRTYNGNGEIIGYQTVKTGEDVIWFFEKWLSGKFVCWCKTEIENMFFELLWDGTIYYVDTTIELPKIDGEFVLKSQPSNFDLKCVSPESIVNCSCSGIDKSVLNWYTFDHKKEQSIRDVKFYISVTSTWK